MDDADGPILEPHEKERLEVQLYEVDQNGWLGLKKLLVMLPLTVRMGLPHSSPPPPKRLLSLRGALQGYAQTLLHVESAKFAHGDKYAGWLAKLAERTIDRVLYAVQQIEDSHFGGLEYHGMTRAEMRQNLDEFLQELVQIQIQQATLFARPETSKQSEAETLFQPNQGANYPILPDAIIHGEAVASPDGTTVSIHGWSGHGTSIWVEKDQERMMLPGATIVGTLATGEYVAWDGTGYVFRPTQESILADSTLMLIGKVKRNTATTTPLAKHIQNALHQKQPAPTSGKRKRASASVQSERAARKMEAYIEAHGLGYTEFANKVHTTDKTLRNFRNSGKVRRDIFENIAEAMGITKEELLNS